MSGRTVVGVDIGGTFIKLGLVRAGRILCQRAVSTRPYSRNSRRLIEGLTEAVRALVAEAGVRPAGIGVGIPGLVDFPSGNVRTCVNLQGWKDVPLKRLLQRRFRLPVAVDNDVNVMTLAEWRYGAGRGASNLVCLTLGTGVGGGLVLDGKLFRSAGGPTGEIGHLPLGEKGPTCPCGGRACLERFVGNRDILRDVRRRLRRGAPSRIRGLVGGRLNAVSPEIIDQACAQADRFALGVWRRAGEAIGLALVQVVNLLNPERIVVGGGIARAGEWILEPARRVIRARAMRGIGSVPVVPARLGSSAGLVGAAVLARETLRR